LSTLAAREAEALKTGFRDERRVARVARVTRRRVAGVLLVGMGASD